MNDKQNTRPKSVNWGGRKQGNATQSVNWGGRALNVVVALALLLALLPLTSVPAATARAQPQLLQLAAEQPDAMVRVIVQKQATGIGVEEQVAALGGAVTTDLRFINAFAAEMKASDALQLARADGVRWVSLDAPLVSTSAGLATVRDEFVDRIYNGNNGSVSWSGDWTEVGEPAGTDPTKGVITVASINRCAGGTGKCLRLDPNPAKPAGIYIYRQIDLAGAASATLSLYRKNELGVNAGGAPGTDEEVKLEISADGGASWTTLRIYSSTEFTGADTDTFDIVAYASSNTQIRFVLTKQQTGYRFLYVDDVQIEYVRASEFLAAVGAEQLRAATGLDGQGVTVAVVDSGIANHADLQTPGGSRIIGSVKFGNHADTDDAHGHGTHVAGIIAGNGGTSNGQYAGVAPGVNLVNVRVADDQGMSYTSDLVAGLQWIDDNKAAYNIRVVNISLNSSVSESYHTNPIDAAVEILWFKGVTVVVSAGNNGTGSGSVALHPPANDPFVVTVGAAEDMGTPGLDDDTLAVFSAYGPTEDGFAKPELVAPGRNLVSLLASPNAVVNAAHPAHRVDNAHFRMSGTSTSAPVVAGAVALLLQDEPNLTPDQVKYRLMATANTNWSGYDPVRAGAGYLDIYAAVAGMSTESANQGVIPHQMLAKAALIALWASLNGGPSIDWGTVDWNSVDWNSVDWNSVDWNSVDWNSVDWNSVDWNSVDWNSVDWNSVDWNSVDWNSVDWNSVDWNSVDWSNDYWGD